jgi:hypothetical protein
VSAAVAGHVDGPASARSAFEALYERALPATRTGPLYNAFSYPTKISPEAIALFVAMHTRPGDTVLDVFAGSGTTGIAAKLCARPTPEMLALAAKLGVEPQWGPRRAVLYDIGVLGSFVARVMCKPPDPERFRLAATELVRLAQESHGWLYNGPNTDGSAGAIRHVIWSEVLACCRCGRQTTYWDAAVRRMPVRLSELFVCEGCRSQVRVGDCARVNDTVYDPLLGREVVRRRRVPVRIYGRTEARTWSREVTDADREIAERAAATTVPASAPVAELAWGDLYRAGYHTGITHLHHFYTPRNFLAVSLLWDLVGRFDADLRDALRLLILSFNATHSTLMTRVVVKQNQKDFILTGAQTGVLYISGLPVEKNVFEGVRRKIATFEAAFDLVHGSPSEVEVVNASSASLDLADGSIDYVFTDPPFGGYIPYAELNQINELWLGAPTDRRGEIIMSAADGKDAATYGRLMGTVFGEVARVLTDDGAATVVFHSAHSSVWQALTDAYGAAGFGVRMTSVLHKTQPSFKQVVSPIAVKDDPLILLDKQRRYQRPRTIDEVVEAVLADAASAAMDDERQRERLFSRFVTRCLLEGVPVTLGASEFYEWAMRRQEQI